MLKRFKNREFYFLLTPPYLWLAVFFVIPLLIVFFCSVSNRDPYGGVKPGFTLEHYKAVFQPIYLKIFLRSFVYAIVTTAVTLLLSYPMAYFIAFSKPRTKVILLFLVIIPFWTNFLIRMYSWIIILGNNGLANNFLLKIGIISKPLPLLNNAFSVITGLVYCELPYMILPIFAAIDRMDASLIEASMDLGSNKFKTFMRVTVPMSMTGIVAGIIFVFIPTIGNFVVADILGGNDSFMIGNVITSQFQHARNWPLGSALSSVLTFIVMFFIALYIRYSEKHKSNLVEV